MNRITSFLEGKTVFITGATGFLGQPLVEKILWSAPNVRRIYVLIRPKRLGGRQISSQQRLEKELFRSSVFERMRAVYGDGLGEFLREKLVAVPGDISLDGLGIPAELYETIRNEVDIVINSAAVVSFDSPLDSALALNVLGAQRVARFANDCPKAILIHVSTAYVSGTRRGAIPETNYHKVEAGESSDPFPLCAFTDVDLDIQEICRIIQEVREEAQSPAVDRKLTELLLKRRKSANGVRQPRRREQRESLRKKWLETRLIEAGMSLARRRGWNDTYTYTKAMGEQLVAKERAGRPTVIIRPSIIESSLSEPCPGWLDGLRMADPLIVAIGKGRLKSLPLDPNVVLDLVPVDMVVNVLLASLLDAEEKGNLRIYQIATGHLNPATLGQLYQLIYRYFSQNPMLDRAGQPIRVKKLSFPRRSTFRLQHRLRDVPLDTVERTLEKLSIFSATQKYRRRVSAARAANQKLYYYGEIYEPYLNLHCRFQIENSLALLDRLTPAEREEFDFDVTRLNWRHYVQNVHIPGVKKYILKMQGEGTLEIQGDSISGSPEGGTIYDLLVSTAKEFGLKTAMQIKRDGIWHRFSYQEVLVRADRIAVRLAGFGLQKGDRLVLFSENQPEWGITYFAAASLGLVVVPLDSQTWAREVWSVARFTEAKAILASESCFRSFSSELLAEEMEKTQPVLLLNVNRECLPFEGFPVSCSETTSADAGDQWPVVAVSPDDPASIIFTTGTLVDPKGAVHTHRNFLSNLFAVKHYLPLSSEDNLLSVLPLYHALEFTCGFLAAFSAGATITYLRSLKPKVILETMRETGTTTMLGVPTLYALIRDDLERRVLGTSKSALRSNIMETSKQISHSIARTLGRNIGKKLFARVHEEFGGKLRLLVSGGSALGCHLYDDFKALGLTIYEGYGLTETAPVLTVNPWNLSRRGSAGKAVPGVEISIFRPDKNGVGEIVARTPSLMKEYFRNERATKEVLREGWFHTGDLGWVDEDGYIYITGRIKDVIVTGAGKNVYPCDLEAIYQRIPEISEICVFGIRNGLTEDVHAIVRPNENLLGELPPSEAKKRIQREIQKLGRELPSYQRFQHVHLRTEPFPRKDDGTIDRDQVKAALIEALEGKRQAVEAARIPSGASVYEVLTAELSRLSRVPAKDITPESNLYSDLGLDSLMAIELLLFVENRFGVSVPDDKAAKLQTVSDVLAVIRAGSDSAAPAQPRQGKAGYGSALTYSERSSMNRFLLALSFGSMKMLYQNYFDLELANPDKLPKGTSYIIAANHASHLDSGAIISALGTALGLREARKLHVLGARDYFFDSPVKSWFFSTFLNVIPIDREDTSLSGLRMVQSIVSRGEPILIFPEGTRSRTGQLQGFKPGLGLLARELKVPIVPAYIGGTREAMPVGKLLPRRTKVRVVFGPAISVDGDDVNGNPSRDEHYRAIVEKVRNAIEELRNKFEVQGAAS
ncbi:MAG TPA: AMP-binding protein [Acidobacteriota bacterium]|nr:AMP-binding protein [Acidobacteriota bacterium]